MMSEKKKAKQVQRILVENADNTLKAVTPKEYVRIVVEDLCNDPLIGEAIKEFYDNGNYNS